MADLFADTAGWGHLIDPREEYHSLASSIYVAAREQGRKLVTTNYVIAELVALCTSPLHIPRATALAFIDDVQTSPFVEIVHIDTTRHEQAWHLLKRRSDKEWSLVDSASFIIMQERGLTEALTSDRHFEQAGFVRLLKS